MNSSVEKNSYAAATFSGSIDETTCVPFGRLFVTASSQPFLIVKDVVHAQNIQRICIVYLVQEVEMSDTVPVAAFGALVQPFQQR